MPILTILVPNYNRPLSLAKALDSAFTAIEYARASSIVDVLVVDDFSTEDVSRAIAPHLRKRNFRYLQQTTKCGNAELAFLSALEHVNGTFVWLVGNDDQILPHGVSVLLKLLRRGDYGFVLLNPVICRPSSGEARVPMMSDAPVVLYKSSEDLFMDFGFVTSTTTFSCIVAHTKTLNDFHKNHRLTSSATVYSHTFTLFCAHQSQRAAFIAKPLTIFSLNEAQDEIYKLARQAPHEIMFYHHSIGLAQLIRLASNISGMPVAKIGQATEDEIDKSNMKVVTGSLAAFLVRFAIEQFISEQYSLKRPKGLYGYLIKSDIDLLRSTIELFNDRFLADAFYQAEELYGLSMYSADWKISFMRTLQARITRYASEERATCIHARQKARKVKSQSFSTVLMLGTRADEHGRELTTGRLDA